MENNKKRNAPTWDTSKHIPEEVKEQWVYLRTVEKKTLKEIAEITNSNINTIAAHLYDKGIHQKRPEQIAGRHEQWIELRLQGVSVIEIARRFNVSTTTLYKFFSNNDIILQKHKKPVEPPKDPENLIFINGYWLQEDEAKRYSAIHALRRIVGDVRLF